MMSLPVNPKRLLILGVRGIPAAHGGFETFAEHLAVNLTARGWEVTVYCQEEGGDKLFGPVVEDRWNGIRRLTIATSQTGPWATMIFDWAAIGHAVKEPGVILVLGYNTALFAARFRPSMRPVIMNMDGIEWMRAKWGLGAKLWFYLNEWAGALFSTKLVADHPRIADHLARCRRREDIATIAYGSDAVMEAPEGSVRALGLEPGRYFISIGRVEPENSTLELVRAFCADERDSRFICLGKLEPATNRYHAAVVAAANDKVLFPGAIYDQSVVKALRYHALAYCHGHTVGGTNPSLVEALGAGNAVIAHDNVFNRYVAGDEALYFSDIDACRKAFARAEQDGDWRARSRNASRARHAECYTWEHIFGQYEQLFGLYAGA